MWLNWTMVPCWRWYYYHSPGSNRPCSGWWLSLVYPFWQSSKMDFSNSYSLLKKYVNTKYGPNLHEPIRSCWYCCCLDSIGHLQCLNRNVISVSQRSCPCVPVSGLMWISKCICCWPGEQRERSVIGWVLWWIWWRRPFRRWFYLLQFDVLLRRQMVFTKANSTKLPKMNMQQPRNHTSDTLM